MYQNFRIDYRFFSICLYQNLRKFPFAFGKSNKKKQFKIEIEYVKYKNIYFDPNWQEICVFVLLLN